MNKKLKPVIYITDGKNNFYKQDLYTQNLLIKAISVGVTNPKELQKVAGLKSVAEVYRTLDKMAIRKEYHQALNKAGIDLDYMVGGIKKICDTALKDNVKLKAFQVLLKSVGLETYDKSETSTSSWEDAVIKQLEKEKEKRLIEGEVIEIVEDYEVKKPQGVIDDENKNKDENNNEDLSIYESRS